MDDRPRLLIVDDTAEDIFLLSATLQASLARKIQSSLLPPDRYHRPGPGGCDIATALRPARTSGGEFYDYVQLGPDRLLFAVGDVSAKGVAAALFMVRVVTWLQRLAPSATDPSQLLRDLNQALCRDNEARVFVTLGCGLIDLKGGEILYSSAGHPPPLRLTPRDNATFLDLPGGPALGLFAEAEFPAHTFQLAQGQSLVLYCAGLIASTDHHNLEFGGERLLQSLSHLPQCAPESVLSRCLGAVQQFTAGAEPSDDDVTVLVIQPCLARHGHWQVPNTLKDLALFSERLRTWLAEAGCSEEAIQDLDLVCEELLVNTIEHGYDRGQQDHIDIGVSADPYQVRLVLRDGGREFDPLQAEERPEEKVGGWGIPLVHHLMDEFHYQRIKGINQVTVLRRERES